MSVNKPTSAQLTDEWEALLEAEGLGHPEKDLNFVTIRDTDGVRIPAQPAREGGVFWRERAAMLDAKQDRKKTERSEIECPCGKTFAGTKRGHFCSRTCIDRFGKRRRRARLVPPNIPLLSEETAQ